VPPPLRRFHLEQFERKIFPKREAETGREAVTIAAGFRCRDGIVLCADSEITLGQGGKTYQAKMFPINVKADAYLVYAGVTAFVREFVYELKKAVMNQTGDALLNTAGNIYKDFHRQHYTNAPKAERTYAHILLTAHQGKRVLLWCGQGRHWYPVEDYQPIGIGTEHAETLIKAIYSKDISVSEAAYGAAYMLRKTKQFVGGCGGDSRVRQIFDEPRELIPWPTWKSADTIKRIENDFAFLEAALIPVILNFPNIDMPKKQFNGLLGHLGKELRKHRIENLRFEKRRYKQWMREHEGQE
jgi:20S proteasome alpha/beta subunit